jgi:hypothetical protein
VLKRRALLRRNVPPHLWGMSHVQDSHTPTSDPNRFEFGFKMDAVDPAGGPAQDASEHRGQSPKEPRTTTHSTGRPSFPARTAAGMLPPARPRKLEMDISGRDPCSDENSYTQCQLQRGTEHVLDIGG